jgi:hypothetical protein
LRDEGIITVVLEEMKWRLDDRRFVVVEGEMVIGKAEVPPRTPVLSFREDFVEMRMRKPVEVHLANEGALADEITFANTELVDVGIGPAVAGRAGFQGGDGDRGVCNRLHPTIFDGINLRAVSEDDIEPAVEIGPVARLICLVERVIVDDPNGAIDLLDFGGREAGRLVRPRQLSNVRLRHGKG